MGVGFMTGRFHRSEAAEAGWIEGAALLAKTGSHMLTTSDTAYVKSSKGWMFCEDSKIAKAQEKDVVVSLQRPNFPHSTFHFPHTRTPEP
jgi:hypothetical protein